MRDQAETWAQLFYVEERSYGFEQELDVAIKVVMVMKDMICKKKIQIQVYMYAHNRENELGCYMQ